MSKPKKPKNLTKSDLQEMVRQYELRELRAMGALAVYESQVGQLTNNGLLNSVIREGTEAFKLKPGTKSELYDYMLNAARNYTLVENARRINAAAPAKAQAPLLVTPDAMDLDMVSRSKR